MITDDEAVRIAGTAGSRMLGLARSGTLNEATASVIIGRAFRDAFAIERRAPFVPPGWKLVPEESTPEIREAFWLVHEKRWPHPEWPADVYRAMLAAAPPYAPETEGQP